MCQALKKGGNSELVAENQTWLLLSLAASQWNGLETVPKESVLCLDWQSTWKILF